MEVPKIEAAAAAQTDVGRGARVLLCLPVAAGHRPKLVLDMSLAVLPGLVLVHLINQRVVWTSMERLRQLYFCLVLVIFDKGLLPFPSTKFR